MNLDVVCVRDLSARILSNTFITTQDLEALDRNSTIRKHSHHPADSAVSRPDTAAAHSSHPDVPVEHHASHTAAAQVASDLHKRLADHIAGLGLVLVEEVGTGLMVLHHHMRQAR